MALNFNQVILEDVLSDVEAEKDFLNQLEGQGEAEIPVSPKGKKNYFNYELDNSLLLESTTVNPFLDQTKWAQVSHNVTQNYRSISKDSSFLLSSRGCKDRVNLLLKQLEAKEEKKLKR